MAPRISNASIGGSPWPRAASTFAMLSCGLPITNSSFAPAATNASPTAARMASALVPPNVPMRRVAPANCPSAAACRASATAGMAANRARRLSMIRLLKLRFQQRIEPDEPVHRQQNQQRQQDHQGGGRQDGRAEFLLHGVEQR